MHISILQPPLVQLNTPYPSGAYLSAFFRKLAADSCGNFPSSDNPSLQKEPAFSVEWTDLNVALFHRIFCAEGLSLLFSRAGKAALKAAANADTETAFNIRRYLSQKNLWINWIDAIVSILKGTDREICHEFVRSPHVPRGMRMERYLASLQREVTADDARLLASFAIEDIADFITAVFDSQFSLVHYAASIAASYCSFADLETSLNAPVLTDFFAPVIRDFLDGIERRFEGCTPLVFCISLPFPGTLAAGLFLGRAIGERFGSRAVRVMGGGYVNTELRGVCDLGIFAYTDFLSYDRGYGSWKELLDRGFKPQGSPVYKTAYLYDGGIVRPRSDERGNEKIPRADVPQGSIVQFEDDVTRSIVPDYRDIDFSLYPRLADDVNPMHRIWSDGAWLKAYLAHGCYWHQCAFCDVTLDYVRKYIPVDIPALHTGLIEQAKLKGVYGVHFVDEAAPPRFLRDFALRNCVKTGHRRLSFWGNIRFEKSFTRDLTDFLSYSGMTGVSGGIEIATGDGLLSVNKGTDIRHLTATCAAFKESGILVHAYMIFGWWEESPQDLINSLETLRQLFAAGLVDSAFWHKFVLTRHSRVFSEWKQGKHQHLKPIVQDKPGAGLFAENDLRFYGEEKSARYASALNQAVSSWMEGNGYDVPVARWFSFPMPAPTVSQRLIDSYIAEYEKERDGAYSLPPKRTERFTWLGGVPVITEKQAPRNKRAEAGKGKNRDAVFSWFYMGEEYTVDVEAVQAEKAAVILALMSAELAEGRMPETAHAQDLYELDPVFFRSLRGRGLCRAG